MTQDYDFYRFVRRGVRLVEDLLKTEEVLFGCTAAKRLPPDWRLTYTNLGRRLADWSKEWHHNFHHLKLCCLEEYTLEAHPCFRLLEAVDLVLPTSIFETPMPEADARSKAQELNNQVRRLRKIGRGEVFKQEIAKRRRHSLDSVRELKRYLRSISEKHAKLLVLRLDFGYQHDPAAHPVGPRVKPDTLNAHRQQIVSYFKKVFAAAALGYVIKTEFGLYKGPHLHAVFILDGSKVRGDIKIAQMLGERWREVVTSGQGSYFSCNIIKNNYLNSGIGMVDYRDPQDWLGAERMVEYITKVDYMVRVWAAGHRTLVKGWMPRQRAHKRGRPRTKFTGCELSDQ